ncbi:hypothetical protein [Pseudomonas citronellolis]|uniref:hypothetical protein n=1 Tax=Pseudomonas citronellolis TaxID=53408 RepID=UPI001064AF5D|nr:hypothetical protein [Pseudomonas humi]
MNQQSSKTALYPVTKRRVDELEALIADRIQVWRMFPAKWELNTTDYRGKEIHYRGIKYSGSPEMVFWSYFPPFFENEIPKVLGDIYNICKERNLPPRAYLLEAGALLKSMTGKLWVSVAKTHQLLKGGGLPKECDLRDMSGVIADLHFKIDEEIEALILSGENSCAESETVIDDILEVKPNFMGIGLNFNAIWRRIDKWRRRRT